MKSDLEAKRKISREEVSVRAGILNFAYLEASVHDIADFKKVLDRTVLEVVKLRVHSTMIDVDDVVNMTRIHPYKHNRRCCN